MSLGVLTNISAIYAQNNIRQTQSSLQKTLQELSSGSRINSGADDAAGLAVADGLNANVAALTQSARNASDGIGLLQTADGALSQVTTLLDRATTLATQAANGTLNGGQVSSANQEYQNILTQIGNIGATTNFNSNSVFTATAKTVFLSDGTSNGANVYSEVVGALTTASVGISAPSSTGIATGAVAAGAATTSSTSAASVVAFAAVASGSTVSGTIKVGVGTGTAVSSTIAAGTTLAAAVTQLNTDLASINVTASIGTGAQAGQLILTGPTGASKDLVTTGTSLVAAAAAAATAGTPTNLAAGTGSVSAAGTASVLKFDALASGSTLSGVVSIKVGAGAAVTSTLAAGTTIAAALTQLNADFAASNVTATEGTGADAGKIILTGPATATSDLDATGSSLVGTTAGTSGGSTPTPAAGAGTDFTAVGVSSLTAATAQTVLTTVTAAIQNVAYQRGIIGANINQLTSATNVAATQSTNLTAASSNISSTDYGQATSDLAKYQVLSQTGISALAQANTVQQEVLKLLQ